MCWNLVFNMHYRFLNVLKFSKCFFKMFSTHFKHKNSPMVWTMLKTVLKSMSNISKCFENHSENFKACWKLYQNFWKIKIKIKSDNINEDYRSLWCYMWSVIEILCDLEEKIRPVCMQLLHNVHATEIFLIQPCCELPLFSFKLSKLIRYFY